MSVHSPMPHRQPLSPKRRGFTLIELLVVVLIIGILAALLLPAYRKLTSSSMGAKNMANHRAIAGALITYAQENKGQLPWGYDNDPPFGDGASAPPYGASPYPKTLTWLEYVDDGRIFFSPMFWPRWGNKESALLVINNPSKYASNIVPWAYSNYGVNRYGAMPNRPDGGRQPANLLRVGGDGNLGKLMLTRDTYEPSYDQPSNPRGGGIYWFVAGSIPPEKDTYGGIIHTSYADGHVEGISHRDFQVLNDKPDRSGAPFFKNVYVFDP